MSTAIMYPRISSVARLREAQQAASQFQGDNAAYHVGLLQAEVKELIREYNNLLDAYKLATGDDSDQLTDAQLSVIANSIARETVQRGDGPHRIPKAVSLALDELLACGDGTSDFDDEDDDILSIAGHVTRDVRRCRGNGGAA